MSLHEKFKRSILRELPSILAAAGEVVAIQDNSEPYGKMSRSKAKTIAAGLRGVANEIDLNIAQFARDAETDA